MLKTYDDQKITVIQATPNPSKLISLAASITTKELKDEETISYPLPHKRVKLIKFMLTANHTSLFEHATITVLIQGISRSLLAQVTRHRMGSFTSGSQHYQKYSDYDDIVDAKMKNMPIASYLIDASNQTYTDLIKHYNVPAEEARQILTNSKAVNLLWTTNARSLINFLNIRLCKRNVKEMYAFARNMETIANQWFPELFHFVGPDCKMLGFCRQGFMKAEECRAKTVQG